MLSAMITLHIDTHIRGTRLMTPTEAHDDYYKRIAIAFNTLKHQLMPFSTGYESVLSTIWTPSFEQTPDTDTQPLITQLDYDYGDDAANITLDAWRRFEVRHANTPNESLLLPGIMISHDDALRQWALDTNQAKQHTKDTLTHIDTDKRITATSEERHWALQRLSREHEAIISARMLLRQIPIIEQPVARISFTYARNKQVSRSYSANDVINQCIAQGHTLLDTERQHIHDMVAQPDFIRFQRLGHREYVLVMNVIFDGDLPQTQMVATTPLLLTGQANAKRPIPAIKPPVPATSHRHYNNRPRVIRKPLLNLPFLAVFNPTVSVDA